MSTITGRLGILLTLMVAAVFSADAADGLIASPGPGWAQWRGAQRDGISSETGLLQQWPEGGPRLLWKADGLGRGWSCPVIQDGQIYVTGDEGEHLRIVALDLDGRQKWSVTNGDAWHRSYPGARAACTLAGGHLYHMNAHGRVVALDAATGEEKWAVSALDRFAAKNVTWAISENLLVDGEHVIVTPAGNKALMAALDRKNGETIWITPPIDGEKAAYSSPILVRAGERRILFNYTNPHAFAVDADSGDLLWKHPLKTRWGAAVATPVFVGDGVIFQAPDGPGMSKFSLDGKLLWHSDMDALTGGGLYRDGRLYVNGCKASRTLQAVDVATGKSLYELPRFTELRPPKHATGALVWADARLYALFEDGYAALLKPTNERFDVVGKFRLLTPKKYDVWAHPVVLNGRLYLRYHDTLYCYDVTNSTSK